MPRLVRWTPTGTKFIAAVTAAGAYAPGGLSQQEIDMIGVTNQVSLFKPATYAVTNLPFHLLQSLSILLLGVTSLSAKLPAIILSIAVAVHSHLGGYP